MSGVAPVTKVVKSGINYTHHPHHRNGWGNKSQWRISETAELASFESSIDARWVDGHEAWGVHRHEQKIHYLGVAQDHSTEVFVAKFIDSSRVGDWHGYPADHQANMQDRPSQTIVEIWLRDQVVPLPKLRKLIKGQTCKL